jgi:hypothetical protein
MSKALSSREVITGAVAASALGAAVLGDIAITHSPAASSPATAMAAAQTTASNAVHGYRLSINDHANSGDNETLTGKYDASQQYGELDGDGQQIAFTPRGEFIKTNNSDWKYEGPLPTNGEPVTALSLDPGHALMRLQQLDPNTKPTNDVYNKQYTGVYERSDRGEQVIDHVQLTLDRNGLPVKTTNHETTLNGDFVLDDSASLSDYGVTVQPPNIH